MNSTHWKVFDKYLPVLLLLPGLLSGFLAPLYIVAAVFICLLIFCLPGLPLIRYLVNDHPPNKLLLYASAVPIGYIVSTAVIAILAILHIANLAVILPVMFLIYISLNQTLKTPATDHVDVPSFNGKILIGACLLVLAMLVLLVIPYQNVGLKMPEGLAYRAYFSGDYLKHVAITSQLMSMEIPPENPYFAGQTLHYYWMFYLFPALLANQLGYEHIQPILTSLNLFLAGTFLWIWIGLTQSLIKNTTIKIIVWILPLFGGSYEGLICLADLHKRKWPLAAASYYNVDGWSRRMFGAPEVDSLYRLLLYNMQHILPAALFLVFIYMFSKSRRLRLSATVVIGLLCALAIGHSGFLGSFLTLWCFVTISMSEEFRKGKWRTAWIRPVLFALIPLVLLLFYKFGLKMLGPEISSGSQLIPLDINLVEAVRSAPVAFFVLNFGATLAGLLSFFIWKRFPKAISCLALLSIMLIAFVSVPRFGSDVAVKVGYTAAISLSLMAGFLLDFLKSKSKLLWISSIMLMILLIVVAIPSLLLEVYNFSELLNPRYLSVVNYLDKNAYDWMHTNTSPDEIIQAGTRTNAINAPFTGIPTFAGRKTYVGDWMHARIFLIPEEEYQHRKAVADGIFRFKNAEKIHSLCTQSGINYVYWGVDEYQLFKHPVHLLEAEDMFQLVYSSPEDKYGFKVHLFRVLNQIK
ncbi:hypothetical protein JW979_12865 [bacterium]|nr:hypothetical protein [candidate division CSSED10-310 bacterium]